MKEYKICNMLVQKDEVRTGGYIIKRVPEYEERIKYLYKSSSKVTSGKIIYPNGKYVEREYEKPLRYGSHQITAIATPVEKEKESVFIKNRKSICDILLLYNFLVGQNACLEEDMDKYTHLKKQSAVLGKKSKINVGFLISEILKEIDKEEWKTGQKDNEILSFLFLLDSRDPKVLQLRLIEKYICFQILESKKFANYRGNLKGDVFKAYNLPNINSFNGEDFNHIITIIRDSFVHGGSCSLNKFRKEMKTRKGFPESLKKYFVSMKEDDFECFKEETCCVMDYLLSHIFIEIFGITDKTDKINEGYFEETNEYFRNLYIPKNREKSAYVQFAGAFIMLGGLFLFCYG